MNQQIHLKSTWTKTATVKYFNIIIIIVVMAIAVVVGVDQNISIIFGANKEDGGWDGHSDQSSTWQLKSVHMFISALVQQFSLWYGTVDTKLNSLQFKKKQSVLTLFFFTSEIGLHHVDNK